MPMPTDPPRRSTLISRPPQGFWPILQVSGSPPSSLALQASLIRSGGEVLDGRPGLVWRVVGR